MNLLVKMFYVFCVSTVGYLYCRFLKLNNYAKMILFVFALSTLSNAFIGIHDVGVYIGNKTSAFSDRTEKIIDKVNEATKTAEEVQKGMDKGKGVIDKLDSVDKAIKEKGFKLREKITGEKVDPNREVK